MAFRHLSYSKQGNAIELMRSFLKMFVSEARGTYGKLAVKRDCYSLAVTLGLLFVVP